MKTKNLLTTLLLLAISITAFSQAEVPQAAKDDLKIRFPNARSIEWEAEDDGFEAEFKESGKEVSVEYDKSGKWTATEREISVKKLPGKVTDAIGKNYPGYKIDEAEIVETAKYRMVYELEIEKGKSEWELLISMEGKILEKESESEDEDDD